MQTNATLKANQAVYLTADKTKAVVEGHKDAKFLLVRAGGEIVQSEAEKYEGALELIGGKTEKPAKTEDKPDPHKGKK